MPITYTVIMLKTCTKITFNGFVSKTVLHFMFFFLNSFVQHNPHYDGLVFIKMICTIFASVIFLHLKYNRETITEFTEVMFIGNFHSRHPLVSLRFRKVHFHTLVQPRGLKHAGPAVFIRHTALSKIKKFLSFKMWPSYRLETSGLASPPPGNVVLIFILVNPCFVTQWSDVPLFVLFYLNVITTFSSR